MRGVVWGPRAILASMNTRSPGSPLVSLVKGLDQREWLHFLRKQLYGALFGLLLLLGILITGLWYPDIALPRYDFLLIYALMIQSALILFRLESGKEFGVILLFHLLATGMELFKTSETIGSWRYPEASWLRLGNVPLFTGFLYSAVGSYLARTWRLFSCRCEAFPPLWVAGSLALLAYLNFFTHHYFPDGRWILIGLGVLLFARTRLQYQTKDRPRQVPLLLAWVLLACAVWLAENLGTFSRAWQYPNQLEGWRLVHLSKLSAWYLLLQLSFVLIYALRQLEAGLARRSARGGRLIAGEGPKAGDSSGETS